MNVLLTVHVDSGRATAAQQQEVWRAVAQLLQRPRYRDIVLLRSSSNSFDHWQSSLDSVSKRLQESQIGGSRNQVQQEVGCVNTLVRRRSSASRKPTGLRRSTTMPLMTSPPREQLSDSATVCQADQTPTPTSSHLAADDSEESDGESIGLIEQIRNQQQSQIEEKQDQKQEQQEQEQRTENEQKTQERQIDRQQQREQQEQKKKKKREQQEQEQRAEQQEERKQMERKQQPMQRNHLRCAPNDQMSRYASLSASPARDVQSEQNYLPRADSPRQPLPLVARVAAVQYMCNPTAAHGFARALEAIFNEHGMSVHVSTGKALDSDDCWSPRAKSLSLNRLPIAEWRDESK